MNDNHVKKYKYRDLDTRQTVEVVPVIEVINGTKVYNLYNLDKTLYKTISVEFTGKTMYDNKFYFECGLEFFIEGNKLGQRTWRILIHNGHRCEECVVADPNPNAFSKIWEWQEDAEEEKLPDEIIIVGVRYAKQKAGCYYYLSNRKYRRGALVLAEAKNETVPCQVVFSKTYKIDQEIPYNITNLKKIIRLLTPKEQLELEKDSFESL